jgi:3'(2'), 5'-bisphosphate nucleotidase
MSVHGNPERLLEVFGRIAQRAGEEIATIYQRVVVVSEKPDRSPLTEADLAAHEIICGALAKEVPGVVVVSEEDAERAGLDGLDEFILVDPLDGTKEFLSKNGDFTVNIALVRRGVPVAGVVLAPARKRAWSGASGLGAWVQDVGPTLGERRPVRVRDRARADGWTAVASRSHRDAETDAFLLRHAIRDTRAVGSSLKFCLVAEGEADVYPRFGPTMEWDTAAGHAVLSAAGGSVTTSSGEPLTYGKVRDGLKNPSFIAWGTKDR